MLIEAADRSAPATFTAEPFLLMKELVASETLSDISSAFFVIRLIVFVVQFLL